MRPTKLSLMKRNVRFTMQRECLQMNSKITSRKGVALVTILLASFKESLRLICVLSTRFWKSSKTFSKWISQRIASSKPATSFKTLKSTFLTLSKALQNQFRTSAMKYVEIAKVPKLRSPERFCFAESATPLEWLTSNLVRRVKDKANSKKIAQHVRALEQSGKLLKKTLLYRKVFMMELIWEWQAKEIFPRKVASLATCCWKLLLGRITISREMESIF